MKVIRIVVLVVVFSVTVTVLSLAFSNDESRSIAECAFELKMLDGANEVNVNDALAFCQLQYSQNSLGSVLAKLFSMFSIFYFMFFTSFLVRVWRLFNVFVDTGKISWRGL